MTNQETFDKVARHLLTQKARAVTEKGCRYRTPDGLKCAVGCLIPDELYDPKMEGKTVGAVQQLHAERAGHFFREFDSGLLDALQAVHDRHEVEQWPSQLLKVADLFGLDTSVLDEFQP